MSDKAREPSRLEGKGGVLEAKDLKAVLPLCAADLWIGPVNAAMAEFGINTAKRRAMFLAQAGHESMQFTRLKECLDYSVPSLLKVFGKYFNDGDEAAIFAHRPEAIANRVYANRMGNGDEASGDGWRFRGRGLIQLTGRRMYGLCGEALKVDLLADPDRLLEWDLAARAAAWYFVDRMPGIALADARNLEGCTRRINGGLNGLEKRQALYDRALAVLGA